MEKQINLHLCFISGAWEHYGKAPLKNWKKEAGIKHPFHLKTNTCYLHVIPFPISGLNWIMLKPVRLLIAPGRLNAHPVSVITQVIQCKHTHWWKGCKVFKFLWQNLEILKWSFPVLRADTRSIIIKLHCPP